MITPELTQYETMKKMAWESEQRVVWEYYSGKTWEPLPVTDDTTGFTGSGFVQFIAPDGMSKLLKFTEERYWIRARLEMGGYVKFPRIRRIVSNATEAYHHQTINDEILGNSDANPLQQFKILHGPVLEGEILEVRERQAPKDTDIADLGPDAFRKVEPDNPDSNEVWVRWKRVDSFFESTTTSRHYTLDYLTGTVGFGDGRRVHQPNFSRTLSKKPRDTWTSSPEICANSSSSSRWRALSFVGTSTKTFTKRSPRSFLSCSGSRRGWSGGSPLPRRRRTRPD